MSDQIWLSSLQKHRVIPVIRASKMLICQKMAMAVAEGGMRLIEITWNSDGARELITYLRAELPHCLIGTGTIFDVKQLEEAIVCGAQFIFSPHTDTEIIKAAVSKNIPIIPGALTPTEIVTAWNYGASCVKVFPIQCVGGVNYIKSLQGPLSHIPLIPTGGINTQNAQDFLDAGAIAVGLGGELFPHHLVCQENWPMITQLARTLVTKVNPIQDPRLL
ncbi:bifunctional 4-hydroxy-2-oxoglutarate aldolase/2-dehydro-3-deoxy-phosphogluconate aldolase [Anabaena sp. FACHB-1237]|uniref:bifunctional 4-hydroxy-2-oxoglutarate aldolase/2-dehydro-3-deoxy-phosphogluconate aldolase n=1 Tax=Anabaena sp. FACHB-1237 TaxID=2692769 RepID=UPI0016814BCE|nr:bifunctional 4-hydroxy-2-oxoglutarate aldolase/2-dehydro-3-deoxy-phosphogluconate aldolase [Anabaena sp. FACHB-1237]MBD2136319.1 bifunctional 4-hydroxy-2-oxoglutarate aldolase/2-dehydro-3-deoxy-phosphogluconate aldolase [Anabaena sp. FACHB-1237]